MIQERIRDLCRRAGVPLNHGHRRQVRIGGLTFGVTVSEQRQLDYLVAVLHPHQVYVADDTADVEIACLGDTGGLFVELVQQDIGIEVLQEEGSFSFGRTSFGLGFSLPNPNIFVNFVDEENGRPLLVSTGPYAEWGALAFLRTALMRYYQKQHALPFHAASLFHQEAGQGLVVATEGFAEGDDRPQSYRYGKTTAFLALGLQVGWCLHTNDEVILSPEQNGVRSWPLPSEVLIKEGTWFALERLGLALSPILGATFQAPDTREKVQAVTLGTLAQAGYSVTDDLPSLKAWVFIDVSPERQSYRLERLDCAMAWALFGQSVFRRRLAQMHAPLFMPEFLVSRYDHRLSAAEEGLCSTLFQALWQEGVTFFSLVVGTDLEQIAQMLQKAASRKAH